MSISYSFIVCSFQILKMYPISIHSVIKVHKFVHFTTSYFFFLPMDRPILCSCGPPQVRLVVNCKVVHLFICEIIVIVIEKFIIVSNQIIIEWVWLVYMEGINLLESKSFSMHVWGLFLHLQLLHKLVEVHLWSTGMRGCLCVTIRIFPVTGSGPRCPDSPGTRLISIRELFVYICFP